MKQRGLIWNSGKQEQMSHQLHLIIGGMILGVESLKIINPCFREISVF
jgi:hypothetical protein